MQQHVGIIAIMCLCVHYHCNLMIIKALNINGVCDTKWINIHANCGNIMENYDKTQHNTTQCILGWCNSCKNFKNWTFLCGFFRNWSPTSRNFRNILLLPLIFLECFGPKHTSLPLFLFSSMSFHYNLFTPV